MPRKLNPAEVQQVTQEVCLTSKELCEIAQAVRLTSQKLCEEAAQLRQTSQELQRKLHNWQRSQIRKVGNETPY